MDTALTQKFPFILDRNLAKANCTEDRVCTSCDKVVLGPAPLCQKVPWRQLGCQVSKGLWKESHPSLAWHPKVTVAPRHMGGRPCALTINMFFY